MQNNIILATTTINPPTKALLRHLDIHDYKIVVAGDLKTPHKLYENIDKVIYLHPEYQEEKYKDLSNAIGWNKIERRNIAIIEAYNLGAENIAVIDDDNIPYDDWGKNVSLNKEIEVNYFNTELPAFDPLCVTNQSKYWQRGYPLNLVKKRGGHRLEKRTIVPKVQVDLWDGDPDIDAIIRMIYSPKINIESEFFPYSSNALIPFNSQNIFIHRSVVKDYFLFPDIGRNHDIFAAYYLTSCGHQVIINRPSVISDRSLGTAGRYSEIYDIKQEYYSMEVVSEMVEDLNKSSNNIEKYLSKNAIMCFKIWKDYFKK